MLPSLYVIPDWLHDVNIRPCGGHVLQDSLFLLVLSIVFCNCMFGGNFSIVRRMNLEPDQYVLHGG